MMYLKRKFYSTTITGWDNTCLEERIFGAHNRKQNAKVTSAENYIDINTGKYNKQKALYEKALERGDTASAEVHLRKMNKYAEGVERSANRVSEMTDTISKTRKSVDSAQGLNIKKEGALSNSNLNLKRDLAGNQTTAVRDIVSKHDVIPGTNTPVSKKRSTFIERNPNAPSSPANPLNATTRKQAQEARHARRLKNKNAGSVVTETSTIGYKGGVNGKPVVVEEVKTVMTPETAKKTVPAKTSNVPAATVKKNTNLKPVSAGSGSSKAAKDVTTKSTKSAAALWKSMPKSAKIGAGIAGGAAVLGTGAYLVKKNKDKKKD